jgi:1-deoxy-D-xylulose-5-phosphate synthase
LANSPHQPQSSLPKTPSDLKKLSVEELRHYAQDLRQKILTTCMTNGGHLGASLGAVELAIALHYVFESPRDSLVWDVGHQAYAHKLITGRYDEFSTLRKFGGISGFLSREESEHDAFGAGHSSTSLSAALAMAWANGQGAKPEKSGNSARPEQDGKSTRSELTEKSAFPEQNSPWSVAIIGDGAITAGLSFEALNNMRAKAMGPLLVVLNDNQMSISPNVGAMPTILSGANAQEFFRLFGFDYVGPIDGHDLSTLLGTLKSIRDNPTGNPIVLHAFTQKGKGYAPAEENPESFHGVSPIAAAKVGDSPAPPKQKSYSEAFGEALCKLAEKDPRIVAVTAAMSEGTGLVEFSRKFPSRFFDVGIAEPHAVTFAAGLAAKGYRPVVAIYSTFLQRALDSVIHDVALQKLGVTFALDRAGLVGADGPTHHGMFDLVYMGMIPEMRIYAPAALSDLESALEASISGSGAGDGPAAIRFPRGSGPQNWPMAPEQGLRFIKKSEKISGIIVALGAATSRAVQAVQALKSPNNSEDLSIISVFQAKPIPQELIQYLNQNKDVPLVVIEDGVNAGGFGEKLYAELQARASTPVFMGYADHFVPHGSPSELETREQISAKALEEKFRSIFSAIFKSVS